MHFTVLDKPDMSPHGSTSHFDFKQFTVKFGTAISELNKNVTLDM